MYMYEINSDKRGYLSTIGKKGELAPYTLQNGTWLARCCSLLLPLFSVWAGDPIRCVGWGASPAAQGSIRLVHACLFAQRAAAEKQCYCCALRCVNLAFEVTKCCLAVCCTGDTVFALVVTAPRAAFTEDAQALRHIQDTFKLL